MKNRMTVSMKGRIMNSLGGFYEVATEEGTLSCRARGLFRKEGVTPLTGDEVLVRDMGDGTGYVEEILPRRNSLIRPPVANLDVLALVVSVQSPPPNLQVLDKLIAVAEHEGIEPVIVVSKTDLESGEEIVSLYRRAGFSVFPVSVRAGTGIEALREYLAGRQSCLCGNTGAGKSSLLNVLLPGLCLETGEVSRKLGRGRHTTRRAQFYPLEGGGAIADTPGFSAMDMTRYALLRREEVQTCFQEFEPYLGRCRFQDCLHLCEAGCAVLEAAEKGEIAPSRLASYHALVEEAGKVKEWDIRAGTGKNTDGS